MQWCDSDRHTQTNCLSSNQISYTMDHDVFRGAATVDKGRRRSKERKEERGEIRRETFDNCCARRLAHWV